MRMTAALLLLLACASCGGESEPSASNADPATAPSGAATSGAANSATSGAATSGAANSVADSQAGAASNAPPSGNGTGAPAQPRATKPPQGGVAAANSQPTAPNTGGTASTTTSSGGSGDPVGGGGAGSAEAQRIAGLSGSPRFSQFRKAAEERHEVLLATSRLRQRLRGKEITEADAKEMKQLQNELSKAGDHMAAVTEGGSWSQDDYLAMDFIVAELIRTRTP